MGPYEKMLVFVARQRLNFFERLMERTKRGDLSLDLVEKYCLIRELNDMAQDKKMENLKSSGFYSLDSVESLDDLHHEDDFDELLHKFELCSDIQYLLSPNCEAQAVQIYEKEILEAGLEDDFEEFARSSRF